MIGFKNVRTSPNSSVGKGSYKKVESESKESNVCAVVPTMSDLVFPNLSLAGRRSTIPKGVGTFRSCNGWTQDTGSDTLFILWDEVITFLAHFLKSDCNSSVMLNF